jgi:hypothetical protein
MEQFRSTESELEESERKREADRVDASRDKEQWGRMLEMSGKLHAKGADERQRLIEEKTDLARRLARFENGGLSVAGFVSSDPTLDSVASTADVLSEESVARRESSNDAVALKREVTRLDTRVRSLTNILYEVKRNSHELDGKAQELLQHSDKFRKIIDLAIKDDQPQDLSSISGSSAPSLVPAQNFAGVTPQSTRAMPLDVASPTSHRILGGENARNIDTATMVIRDAAHNTYPTTTDPGPAAATPAASPRT